MLHSNIKFCIRLSCVQGPPYRSYMIDSLLDRTKHVVAVQTVTKAEFRSSQTHEFEAMKKIIPAIQAKGI